MTYIPIGSGSGGVTPASESIAQQGSGSPVVNWTPTPTGNGEVSANVENTRANFGLAPSLNSSPNTDGVSGTQAYLASALNILNVGTEPPTT